MRAFLPLTVLVAASLAIAAALELLPRPLVFVAKPFATILIGVYAWPRGHDVPAMRRLVLAGLVLSLLGDIALLWPKEGFLPGLVAFLLAHLCYIAAFCRPLRLAARPWPFVVYGLVAIGILAWLWSGVAAGLRAPVIAYVACLASMAAQSAGWWLAARGTPAAPLARSAAIGGALFLASDALLAINKFALPLPFASLWILATYWAAQWAIASSLAPRRD